MPRRRTGSATEALALLEQVVPGSGPLDPDGAELLTRLQALVARWDTGRTGPERGEAGTIDLDAATDDELFALMDSESR